MAVPICAISYSWDSEEHKKWVRYLATNLQSKGVLMRLDQWNVQLGDDLMEYMETCVRESDFVLLICTPYFARKANAGQGGVGYERRIVTGEMFRSAANTSKFIPVLRDGSPENSLPSYLKSRVFIDFRNNDLFESSLEKLLRHLHQSPEYMPPPLGEKPTLLAKEIGRKAALRQSTKVSQTDTLKQVYSFAYSALGMNKTHESAEEFVDFWLEKFADKDFEEFKKVYLFAYSATGMNKTHESAERFARLWTEKFADKDFEEFKRVYSFAYSATGMNKTHEGAEEFALRQLSKM